MKRPRCHLKPLAAAMLLAALPAQALQTVTVSSPSGKAMFSLMYYEPGDGSFVTDDDEQPMSSTYSMSRQYRTEINEAAAYWAEILSGTKNSFAVPVKVGTMNDANAYCRSESNDSEPENAIMTGMQRALLSGIQPDYAAVIRIGKMPGVAAHSYYSTLAFNNEIWSTMVHEMAHGLGISSLQTCTTFTPVLIEYRSVFDNLLVDRYGTRLADAKYISLDGSGLSHEPGVFYAGYDTGSGVSFHGEHVYEVTGGRGITIQGYETSSSGNSLDLSHLELEHSMMSHQNYRNYSMFIEAELAVLQDLGYDIERQNFYGYTVFRDNQSLTNTRGFDSSATLGVGLHIYGHNATVTQAADISAEGAGGTGIRVDGSGSVLTVPDGVTVSAGGDHGTGLLVAYGKDHEVRVSGSISAAGSGGVAVRFDFGHNMNGDGLEYRGSYIRTADGSEAVLTGLAEDGFELNLDGPLVKSFDVSGALTGSSAAIYISENAYVESINFMSGAGVTGDIISKWDHESDKLHSSAPSGLITRLNTGVQAASDGSAVLSADSSFSMTLNGSISGYDSIWLSHYGGTLTVTGTVEVLNLSNAAYLALRGHSGSFGTARVKNLLSLGPASVLETGFDSSGSTDVITVGAIAYLDGVRVMRPAQDFYQDGSLIRVKSAVMAPSVTGSFTSVRLASSESPTLGLVLADADPEHPAVKVSRSIDAYSRYARTRGDRGVGTALYHISAVAQGNMQDLFEELDFTAADGS